MNRLEIQDKPSFKKWVSSQVPSKFPKSSGYRVFNPKWKKEKCTNSQTENPNCGKCGKKHRYDYVEGTDNYFSFGKSRHKVRDYPNVRGQDKGSGQAQVGGSNEAPKKNHFYALRFRSEQESSPNVVTNMLKVFSIDVYTLLDLYAILYFVTPLVFKKFDILPNILHEPFILSNPVGESVFSKRIYRNCPIFFPNRVSYFELVELNMIDFDVILGYGLVACFFCFY